MNRLKQLIHEIHRRSLWQVLAVFLGASWGVIEFVDFLTERAGLAEWTPSMALVFLALGLPVVLGTAFVQEGIDGPLDSGDESLDAKPRGPEPSPGTAPFTGPSSAHPSPPHIGIQRLLTWRNAIAGGVGALGLVALAVAAYFVMWSTGIGPVGNPVAQGVFDEGELIVLADFADPNSTGMGNVVTEALRDGLKAVIQGEVAPVGGGYLLTASVVATETGQVLRAFRVPVASENNLLGGIDRLSREIREKSGESLRSIRQGVGLAQATTGSLDALRLYTEAVRTFDEGRQLEALPLLEEAVELDPEFAMAWRKKYHWHLTDTQLTWHSRRAMWTPVVLERMARIHASRGETAEAEAANQRIIEQVGEGDGPFVPFVERARNRLRAPATSPG